MAAWLWLLGALALVMVVILTWPSVISIIAVSLLLVLIVAWWRGRSRAATTETTSTPPSTPPSVQPARAVVVPPPAAAPVAPSAGVVAPGAAAAAEAAEVESAAPALPSPPATSVAAEIATATAPAVAAAAVASRLATDDGPSPGDDLTEIEGIGPKVAGVLHAKGINTFADLAGRSPKDLRAILEQARLSFMDPETWPDQAALAAAGKTGDLVALQQQLEGGRRRRPDHLTMIEGIGPKIESILVAHGISTFRQLAATDVAALQDLLKTANLHLADPTTWPEQAKLAAAHKMDELRDLQDSLKGGRRA